VTRGKAIVGSIAALAAVMLAPTAMAEPASATATTTIEDPVGTVVLDQPLQLLTTSFNLLVIGPTGSSTGFTTLSSSRDDGKKKGQDMAKSDLPQQSVSEVYSQNDSDNLRNPVAYRRFGSVLTKGISLFLLQFN
jgi:hypothetical protein